MVKFFFFFILILLSCQKSENIYQKKLGHFFNLAKQTEGDLLLIGVEDVKTFKNEASKRGLKVTGDTVVQLSGSFTAMTDIPVNEAVSVLFNERVMIEKFDNPLPPDQTIYYLAKKDFGLPDFWKLYPTYDGRGVVVGVIDDGVSPLAHGLLKTTEGKRKLISHYWTSPLLNKQLSEVKQGDERPLFLKSWKEPYDQMWFGILREGDLRSLEVDQVWNEEGQFFDLNGDHQKSEIDLALINANSKNIICLDSNTNHQIDAYECFGLFDEIGEFGYWTQDHLVSVEARLGSTAGEIRLSYGERFGDDHGEGVASVFVGHKIGGKFDGVAPGAQLLDVDFSTPSSDFDEGFYNIGSFIKTLEWLGQNHAEVINISYGLYFESVKAQEFMRKALEALIKKYNYVVSFSAGNNGPGLGSFNRQSIYPDNALVAGAFVSRDLDEYVHGVTGLPEPGKVVSYSSRGPGPTRGKGPVVISPLASLTHSVASDGFSAFSGTSSASPALAGLATVLISAIKQRNLKVDASAVVHAIRQSGTPLEATPFVDQGYGLPKISRALEIYETLIEGRQFADVKAEVTGQEYFGSERASGIFLKMSEIQSDPEFYITLKGVLANSVAEERGSHLLVELALNYSTDWIMGPRRLWLSVGESHMTMGIRRDQLKNAFLHQGGEIFGEINLLDVQSRQRLLTIPITVIDDQLMSHPFVLDLDLSSEEGKRFHYDLPSDCRGLSVRQSVIQGRKQLMNARIYDPSGVILSKSSKEHFFVETFEPGWHQLSFSRFYGTQIPMQVHTIISPLRILLASKAISAEKSVFEIENSGEPHEIKIEVNQAPKLLAEKLTSTKESGSVFIKVQIHEPGQYSVELLLANKPLLSYHVPSCVGKLFSKDLSLIKIKSTQSFTVEQSEVGGEVYFECRPFSYIEKKAEETVYQLKIVWLPSVQKIYWIQNFLLEKGRNFINVEEWKEKPEVGGLVNIHLSPVVGAGSIHLGQMKVY